MDGIVWVDSFTNSKVVVGRWNYWEMRNISDRAIQKQGLKYKGGDHKSAYNGVFFSPFPTGIKVQKSPTLIGSK